MTFYQVVNEIRKSNKDGEFLYLNPHFCDAKDKLVLFCDMEKLKNLPDGFKIMDSKLIDESVNPNKEYAIRPLSILKNINANSEGRLFPKFDSEVQLSSSIKSIISEIKKLNVEEVDGIKKNITFLYDEDRKTFVCNKDLKSLKLPNTFIKLGSSNFKVGDEQYSFVYSPLKISNYSSYIYPSVLGSGDYDNIKDLFKLIKLLNPDSNVGYVKDNGSFKLFCTIDVKNLVMPDNYYVNDLGKIYCNDGNLVCEVSKVNRIELSNKINSGDVKSSNSNVFGEMNKARKYIVYELDEYGNFKYDNDGKRITKEGTLSESIESLKKARSALIQKKEAATSESIKKSEMVTAAFFRGKNLADANNEGEYNRIVESLERQIENSNGVKKSNYEVELSEFKKGYEFNKNKEIIERRNKHIIKKKVYTGGNQENILIGASMLAGAGMAVLRREDPSAFFEYVETEKFKKAKKERKPGFLARGCKKLYEKIKFYSEIIPENDEVDINAYAR